MTLVKNPPCRPAERLPADAFKDSEFVDQYPDWVYFTMIGIGWMVCTLALALSGGWAIIKIVDKFR